MHVGKNIVSEQNLPEDLQEKVVIACEVANSKFIPADIEIQLLAQHEHTQYVVIMPIILACR